MFGSNILEVAIGVVFVYLLLSLLCTTINEQVITRILALRAKTLEDSIKNMMAHPQAGDELVKQIYNNPLIKGLSQNAASSKPRKPSYIPADLFAAAVMSSKLVQSYKNNPDAVDSHVPEALALIIQRANNDTDFWGWILKIVGLLATTFAISLGAPFWFDVLNKFIAFRASGPPPQPSPSSAGPAIPTTKLVVEAAPSSNNIIPPVADLSNTNTQPSASNGGSTGNP